MVQPQRFTYVILVLCAVVVVGWVLLGKGSSGLRRDFSQNAPSSSSGTAPELKFRRLAIFDGKTTEGARFANYIYKSSDCLSLSSTTTFFGSSWRASEEIQRETEKAPVVLERGPKLDDKGQWVGERVVMEFKTDGENRESARIIWNNRSDFHSIVGPSCVTSLSSTNRYNYRVAIASLDSPTFALSHSIPAKLWRAGPKRAFHILSSTSNHLIVKRSELGPCISARLFWQKRSSRNN
jgi:hypothetical protein